MIIAVVGPSGAGKDTLIAAALKHRPDIHLIRRVISRPTEAGGEDFEGVTADEFDRRKAAGEFALDWQAHGLRYGLPQAQFAAHPSVLFNGSRAALPEASRRFPGLRVIVITAPPEVLAMRLAARGRESAAEVSARLNRAPFDLPPGLSATVIVNDGTAEAGAARLLAALQPVSA